MTTSAPDQNSSISSPYLLVINIPIFADAAGRRYTDQLWFRDLARHLDYLDKFTIACPRIDGPLPENVIALDTDARFHAMHIVDLPGPRSFLRGIFAIPKTFGRLWRAVSNAEIIHCGIAGWPIPLGWLAVPIARWHKRQILVIVESAAWRLQPGLPAPFKYKLRAAVYERLARLCLRRSDLAIFTQDEYRSSLLPDSNKGHVIHASWITEDIVLSDASADEIWSSKLAIPDRPLTILYAGRLDAEKGLSVLLAALRSMSAANARVSVGILGAGPLLDACRATGATLQGTTRLDVLGTVPYGPAFFELLRGYDAVIVPSLSDEQPRIVYDAYSQALPVLATRTPGLADCVIDGETGLLVAPNDPQGICELLTALSRDKKSLRALGLNALRRARAMTHERMHGDRRRLLIALLSSSAE